MIIVKNVVGFVVAGLTAVAGSGCFQTVKGSIGAADKGIERINVIYVLSDNQSYYEMSCHGHNEVKTPNIDRLADQSVDFQRCYAPPYCSPSRSVMMTGKYALRSGVHDTIGGRSIMHKKDKTIADIMRGEGYSTAIFGKWHLGFSYPYRPEDRGFDEAYVHGGGGIGQLEDYYGNTHHDPTFIHNGSPVASKGYSTDTLFTEAMNWIEKQNNKPFFCFISTPATHGPYEAPKGWTGPALNGMIENFDMNVGRLMNKLDELKLSDNTVLIYASDQGMSDRGAPHKFAPPKRDLAHDSKHHVPFMVRVPGGKPSVNKRLAGMIDFVPTVLDLCDIESPDNLDGVSLKPLISGDESDFPDDRVMIIQCPRGRSATKWKNTSVKTAQWRFSNGKRLYDIDKDPRMLNDISASHPRVVKELTRHYEEFWNSLPDQDTTLSRHEIGAPDCPDLILNGMDWYTGAQPWNKKAFTHGPGTKQNGDWAVTIVQDGTYTFELRRFPREANKPIEGTYARIAVGDVVDEQMIDKDAVAAFFTLDLKAGDYDLCTAFNMKPDQSGGAGALFVYVSSK